MNKQQLASKIWAAANEMRSKIEASEYKVPFGAGRNVSEKRRRN